MRDEGDGETGDETLGDFLERGGFTPLFRTHFMESLVACVWSCDPGVALDYPARYLFAFLEHHGMLGVFGSPQWRTVTGGSREYVDKVAAGLHEVRTEHQGDLAARDARRGRADRRQRAGRHLRRGRAGHAPAPGAGHARGADRHPARGARRDPVLGEHRPAAHRHQRAAAPPASPRVVELPAQRRSGDGLLRPDPPAAPARPRRRPGPGHPRRPGPRRPGARHRHDGVRAPGATRRCPWPPSDRLPSATPTGSCSRGLSRLGVQRGRREVRCRGHAEPRGRVDHRRLDLDASADRGHDVRRHHPARAPDADQAQLHPPPAHLAGRPRPASRPRRAGAAQGRLRRRATTWATRTARSRRTSSGSSSSRASPRTAGAS